MRITKTFLRKVLRDKPLHFWIHIKLYSLKDICRKLKIEESKYVLLSEVLKEMGYTFNNKISNRVDRLIESRIGKVDFTNWFNDDILRYCFRYKLKYNLVINKTGSIERYVISFKGHPRANRNSKSNQIKAHILAYEFYNKELLNDKFEISPLDNNFKNLKHDNLIKVESRIRKSKAVQGIHNNFYIHGERFRNYVYGWKTISKNKIESDCKCSYCNNTKQLIVHHIIPLKAFDNQNDAHHSDNLITLCRKCHGKVHQNKITLEGLLSEMVIEKSLKLLETLNYENKEFVIKSISSEAYSNIGTFNDQSKDVG